MRVNKRLGDELNINNNFKEIVSKLSYDEAKELLRELEEFKRKCEEKRAKFKKEFYEREARIMNKFGRISYEVYEIRRECERCLELIEEIEDCLSPRSSIFLLKRMIMSILFVVEVFIDALENERENMRRREK